MKNVVSFIFIGYKLNWLSYLFIGPSLTPIPTGVSSSAKGKMRKEVQDLMNLKYTNALSKFIEIVDTGYLNAGHC